MVEGLRYSPAQSARVSKSNALKNIIKKNKKQLRDLLPAQKSAKANPSGILQNAANLKPKLHNDVPLIVSDYDVHMDYQIPKEYSILQAIDYITMNQWSETSNLRTRYYSKEEQAKLSDHDRLYNIKGISLKSKADIEKIRQASIPHGLVTVTQLYAIYQEFGNTFVDKKLEISIRSGEVRKFIISNASPVIQSSPNKFLNGKVTYGFEDMEIVVRSDVYDLYIELLINSVDSEVRCSPSKEAIYSVRLSSLLKFRQYVKAHPTSLFLDTEQGFSEQELSSLVTLGLLTLNSNHLNELELHQYSISFPSCGSFLKIITSGRVWIVKTLNKSMHKELPESSIFNLWDRIDATGNGKTSRFANFKKPFYGYDLLWLLADSLGAGIVEVFNTPTGRGWKLTGRA